MREKARKGWKRKCEIFPIKNCQKPSTGDSKEKLDILISHRAVFRFLHNKTERSSGYSSRLNVCNSDFKPYRMISCQRFVIKIMRKLAGRCASPQWMAAKTIRTWIFVYRYNAFTGERSRTSSRYCCFFIRTMFTYPRNVINCSSRATPWQRLLSIVYTLSSKRRRDLVQRASEITIWNSTRQCPIANFTAWEPRVENWGNHYGKLIFRNET